MVSLGFELEGAGDHGGAQTRTTKVQESWGMQLLMKNKKKDDQKS